MANTRKRGSRTHGDITGRKAAKKQAELKKEQQEAASQMATVAQREREEQEEVISLVRQDPEPEPEPEFEYQDGTPSEEPEPDATVEAIVAEADQPAPQEVGGIVRQTGGPTVVQPKTKKIRALFDLPQVTIGAGNHFDFVEGRKYEVPANVADHLAEKELVDIL